MTELEFIQRSEGLKKRLYRTALLYLGSGAAVTTVWMLLMILVVFAYNKIFKAEPMD